jgi:simple sugar transport system ATP-binding protein
MRLELKRISKWFGQLRANDCVDLTVNSGTIHAVLGENGAGKSTLMKIIAGYLRPTSGEILIDDRRFDFQSPAQATAHGIGMLYQDPMDFAQLSVLENFMLGRARGLRWSPACFGQTLDTLCRQFGFRLDPHTPVARLSVGERQQLEMLRLLSQGIRLLILDEPTTGISSVQKEALFAALKALAGQGKSVLLVSHKLGDVDQLCDAVTVLRKGRVTGYRQAPFDTSNLLGLMFETLTPSPTRNASETGRIVLEMKGVAGPGGRTGLRQCDIRIAQGEVVGLAGLEGSGQGVFLKIAAGLAPPARGTVQLASKAMTGRSHRTFLAGGVGYLPPGRLDEGLMPGLSVAEHVALNTPASPFFIQWSKAVRTAREKIAGFRIVGTADTRVESLSGGNQQRLMLSFLPSSPKLLLLDNPTRGLDVESAAWVWNHLLFLNRQGAAIVFSSSELDEILSVAHRILVFFEGRIIADLPADRSDSRQLGLAIAGRA